MTMRTRRVSYLVKALITGTVMAVMMSVTAFAATTPPIKSGEYKVPTRDGYEFLGWYDADDPDKTLVIDKDGNWLTDFNEDTRVKAKWKSKPNALYAVAIYDIMHAPGENDANDPGIVDENGNVMGLTFGPATGADYTRSFHSHTPSGTTTGGNAHRCIHNDDWTTIIHWNQEDPFVYEQCIMEGCTHSVELYLRDTLFDTGFYIKKSITPGDGPSALRNEMDERAWNPLKEGGNYRYGTNKGGWGASRVRAVLNGTDELTMKTADSGYCTNATLITQDVESYTKDTCFLNAFPKELQDAIGKRAVPYNPIYNSNDVEISYDKLWLFSGREVWAGRGGAIRSGEGPLMKRAKYKNITWGNSSETYTLNKAYHWMKRQNAEYSSINNYEWGLRSIYYRYNYMVYYVDTDPDNTANGRGLGYGAAYKNIGLAPGFSLSR